MAVMAECRNFHTENRVRVRRRRGRAGVRGRRRGRGGVKLLGPYRQGRTGEISISLKFKINPPLLPRRIISTMTSQSQHRSF